MKPYLLLVAFSSIGLAFAWSYRSETAIVFSISVLAIAVFGMGLVGYSRLSAPDPDRN